ncbi:MAG TPA: hypothetical protein PKD51_15545, partial [Saprospiraceae bacterium]|nr:hypothetical protein [Saprospiraceae bacterium]
MKVVRFLLLVLAFFVYDSSFSQTCSCKEFIYVNEPGGNIHKLEVNPTSGQLTEVGGVNGIPWVSNPANFPSPHGLGVDRNGFLFIGTNAGPPNSIRKLDCTGNVFPETGTTGFRAPSTGDWGWLLTNIQSYDGFIYSNGMANRIYKIDPCTGNTVGYIVLGSDGSDDWGLYIDKNGRFYATQPTGKIFAFTPLASNFTANTVFPLLVDLGANPTYGGLSPQYSGTGLQGIVTDNVGNIYVVEGNRDSGGTPSRLLKFSSTGTLLGAGPIDNLNNGAGWCQMGGIIYSENSNKLYTTSLDPGEDCVFIWNTNLTPVGAAIGPVPTLSGQCKAIGILSERCPQSETITKSVCGVSTGDRISLSDLLVCEGIVCEGQWAAVAGNTNLTFNECDLTVTVGPLPACGSFTITNNGLTGTQCQPYSITLNVSYLASITAQVITGNQTVCPTDNPVAFTVNTNASTSPPGATITYQWQQSTTSATTGYSNISGAMSATYDSGPVSQTTYFRVIASIAGCTGGTCRDTSNVVVLTVDNSLCGPVGDCSCTEYIYLNETTGGGKVHKYAVNSTTGALSEVLIPIGGGNNNAWYPGTGTSQLPSPHGLGVDINGFLYIASSYNDPNSQIRKLTCDGTIFPSSEFAIPKGTFNIMSIGNKIYANTFDLPTDQRVIREYDVCTGQQTGTVCLNNALGFGDWGFWYDERTGYFYSSIEADNASIYRYTISDFSSGTPTCVDPWLPYVNGATVGEMEAPGGTVMGITTDLDGNVYMVNNAFNSPGKLVKYSPTGNYIGASIIDTNDGDGGYYNARGIIYSEHADKLYVSTMSLVDDCVSLFDKNLVYLGPAVPNDGNLGQGNPNIGQGKAISKLIECCPAISPLTFNEIVCSGGNGEKIFLQDVLNCGDGVICEGQWAEMTNTSNGAIVFDDCDLSITVNGNGCATYSLSKTTPVSASQRCGPFTITLTICTEVPTATVSSTQGTCTGITPNNNATINITSVVNADVANFSTGATYTGPAYGGAGQVNITSGSGMISGLMHNTQYTVRIFNGNNDCYVDYAVSTPTITCIQPCSATVTAIPTACNTTTNQYSVSGQVTFTNPPVTGTLTVSIAGGSSEVFSAPFASPIPYTINGQISDGMMKTITATFSADNTCTANTSFMAPASCVTPGSCDCKEYIYLNEPELGAVLKFEIGLG